MTDQFARAADPYEATPPAPGGWQAGREARHTPPTRAGSESDRPAAGRREVLAETATDAGAEVGEVARVAKEEARHTVEVAAEKARETAAQAREAVAGLYDQARVELYEQAERQRSRAGSGLRTFAGEFSELAAASPRDNTAAALVREVARLTDRVAGWLEDRPAEEVFADVGAFARRHPGQFLLIAAGAGLLVGRLMKGATGSGGTSEPGSVHAAAGRSASSTPPPSAPSPSPMPGTVPSPSAPPLEATPTLPDAALLPDPSQERPARGGPLAPEPEVPTEPDGVGGILPPVRPDGITPGGLPARREP